MLKWIYRILTFITKGILSLLIVMLLYFIAALLGSVIPVNVEQPENGEITIYLRTNGVHTDLVFPLKNEVMNWEEIADPQHTLSKRTDFSYISFGWGDLEFYEKTPEWSDLTFPVAFQAVFLPKPSALHVEFMESRRSRYPMVPVEITSSQYRVLSQYVAESFETNTVGRVQPVKDLHYNQNDVFYQAKRSLNFFYTCNTWVNNGLKKANMKACLWTPFDEGIFYHYR